MRAIINETEDAAAAHDSQFAASVVARTAAVMIESVPLVTGIPKKVPAVANPWLAETETEMVMVAVKATSWRYAENGVLSDFDTVTRMACVSNALGRIGHGCVDAKEPVAAILGPVDV